MARYPRPRPGRVGLLFSYRFSILDYRNTQPLQTRRRVSRSDCVTRAASTSAMKMTFKWVLAVSSGCADVVAAGGTDHGSLFDDLWHQFDLHYSYFTVTRVNWDSLGAYYRPIAVSAPNDVQFARVLGAMLAELKDMHVSLSAGPAGTMRYISRFDTTATYFSDAVTLGRYVRIPSSTPSGHIQYGLATDSIGYARIPTFDGGNWSGEMDDAIRAWLQRALIIDVRDNPGDYAGRRLAGRLPPSGASWIHATPQRSATR
jgi:hypothetical protein